MRPSKSGLSLVFQAPRREGLPRDYSKAEQEPQAGTYLPEIDGNRAAHCQCATCQCRETLISEEIRSKV